MLSSRKANESVPQEEATASGSTQASYASTMAKEAAIESYKAKLAGRKDMIDEMKLAIELEDDPDEQKKLKRKLKDFLSSGAPSPTPDMQ